MMSLALRRCGLDAGQRCPPQCSPFDLDQCKLDATPYFVEHSHKRVISMTASATAKKPAPGLLAAFAGWLQKRSTIRQCYLRLEQCDANELAAIAQDVGVSPGELRRMARLGPDAAKLLYQRLEALHLDAQTLAAKEPGAMRDLERLCSSCTSKGRCQRDLVRNKNDPVWRQYCPNEDTLLALQAGAANDR
jgi:hypothetical protein